MDLTPLNYTTALFNHLNCMHVLNSDNIADLTAGSRFFCGDSDGPLATPVAQD
jgi:hypothetical protein